MDLKENSYILHLLDHDESSAGAQRLDTSEVPLKHPLDEYGRSDSVSDVITSEKNDEASETASGSIASQEDIKLPA